MTIMMLQCETQIQGNFINSDFDFILLYSDLSEYFLRAKWDDIRAVYVSSDSGT
jgi:hypothetical protein